jgi:hypothetical protein
VHRAAGGELHHEVGALVQGVDGGGEPAEVERGAVVVVADVHVDHRRAGGLALTRGRHQLLERGRQLRAVGLGGLGPGGSDGDQQGLGGYVGHGGHAVRIPR